MNSHQRRIERRKRIINPIKLFDLSPLAFKTRVEMLQKIFDTGPRIILEPHEHIRPIGFDEFKIEYLRQSFKTITAYRLYKP